MQSHQAVSEKDKKEILNKVKGEREKLLSLSIEKKVKTMTQTILIDSSDDPLYYVDIALGINRREILIEALVSELQRLEIESLSVTEEQ